MKLVFFFEKLIIFDINLFFTINSTHSPFFDIFFQLITWFGSGWVVAPLLVGFVIKCTPQHLWKITITFGIISISASGLINSQIKKAVGRPRPVTYFSKQNLSDLKVKRSNNFSEIPVRILGPTLRARSFPSGHTNTAFAAATFLVLLYGEWFWFSYLIAIMVAYSRIYMGVHFFLDTVAGATLGILFIIITWHVYARTLAAYFGDINDKQ